MKVYAMKVPSYSCLLKNVCGNHKSIVTPQKYGEQSTSNNKHDLQSVL